MKKAIFFILVFCCFSAALYGQDAVRVKRNTLQIQFGANQLKEENLLPKVHAGTITSLAAGFEKTRKNFTDLQFSLGWSRAKTQFEDLSPTVNINLGLAYSYDFSLVKTDRFRYWLGPGTRLQYSVVYYPMWDDSHLYWSNYLSFAAKNVASFKLKNSNELFATLSVPVFSVFSRPDDLRLEKAEDVDFGKMMEKLHGDPSAGLWNRALPLNFTAEYRFPVFGKKTEAFTYSFSYVRLKAKDGMPFQQATHQIGLKLFL